MSDASRLQQGIYVEIMEDSESDNSEKVLNNTYKLQSAAFGFSCLFQLGLDWIFCIAYRLLHTQIDFFAIYTPLNDSVAQALRVQI